MYLWYNEHRREISLSEYKPVSVGCEQERID